MVVNGSFTINYFDSKTDSCCKQLNVLTKYITIIYFNIIMHLYIIFNISVYYKHCIL